MERGICLSLVQRGNLRNLYTHLSLPGYFVAFFLPMYYDWALLVSLVASFIISGIASAKESRKRKEQDAADEEKNTIGAEKVDSPDKPITEVDQIQKEGEIALAEMGRLYHSIEKPSVRSKINELMQVTDKIFQDAKTDPSDLPQIKRFMNYYLPTTIKLLNSYDRMNAQGYQGENMEKSMQNIEDMLDTAVKAYRKQLDSLFENQALDIETEIEVMNKMLAREGLTGEGSSEILSSLNSSGSLTSAEPQKEGQIPGAPLEAVSTNQTQKEGTTEET